MFFKIFSFSFLTYSATSTKFGFLTCRAVIYHRGVDRWWKFGGKISINELASLKKKKGPVLGNFAELADSAITVLADLYVLLTGGASDPTRGCGASFKMRGSDGFK
ncbi:unnamed protein product [Ixodes pacificus]